jgi:tetratricopeptide (TPR) repeat protein
LVDRRSADEAVRLAKRAARLGVRARNSALCREAGITLALACLMIDDVDAAAAAADAAARWPRSPEADRAFALQGITAFRLADTAKARTAFSKAREIANATAARDRNAYQPLEVYALALCGIALCDGGTMEQAVAAYGRAREITPADGAANRSVQLLDLLGAGGQQERLAEAKLAARGRLRPLPS